MVARARWGRLLNCGSGRKRGAGGDPKRSQRLPATPPLSPRRLVAIGHVPRGHARDAVGIFDGRRWHHRDLAAILGLSPSPVPPCSQRPPPFLRCPKTPPSPLTPNPRLSPLALLSIRSEARRVGKECVLTCRSRWS